MFESIIRYFSKHHLLANLIFICVFLGGIFAWQNTKKEEMPAITFDTMRISVSYPGAPAADVEYFITEPIEEAIRGLDGVYRITSTSSVGASRVNVELESGYPYANEAFTEIRNEVLDVDLPDDVINDPNFRVFKTTKKAILDIALIYKDKDILDQASRLKLQEYALALENQLLNLREVHSINRSNYLQKEIQININPDLLRKYNIPFNSVMTTVQANHIRQPAGTMEAEKEPKVTLLSELNTPEKLRDLVVQGGFEGQVIRLDQVASVDWAFEKNDNIMKVNGHEAVMFNVVKSSSAGIVEALDKVYEVVDRFNATTLKEAPVKTVYLDDESIDVRNRINIIASNGGIGFVLIVLILFLFLNKRSGLWVALGIPFTLCFTMMVGSLMGYTINGTTLAAVIIVMGIVVDDAIVVAENISRKMRSGVSEEEAAVKGTSEVFLPVMASIVTTCIAFVPLFFFSGRFGRFTQFIPPVIYLMLGASLIESVLILPGHMELKLPFMKKKSSKVKDGKPKEHWFDQYERFYANILEKILPFKWFILAGFVVMFIGSMILATHHMKFVMFPHEETRDLVLSGYAPEGSTKYETAIRVRDIENVIDPYIGKEVVGYRTEIARSRRGGASEENYFRMIIEIVPKEKRKKSADQLIKEFEQKYKDKVSDFSKVKFSKSRWGSSSGSPIALMIQMNNDEKRHEITQHLTDIMKKDSRLSNVEADEGFRVPEYKVTINREMSKRLSIEPSDIARTLRASLEGRVLYDFSDGEEDVDVRFSVIKEAKTGIEEILNLPVENRNDYLVPLRNIVYVEQIVSPTSISRQDLKRITMIDADLSKKNKVTPLEIAEYYEHNVFPEILAKYPQANLSFVGEVLDTRESQADFSNAIILVVVLIYVILAILFNSLLKPFIIMLAIPFGVVGIILAFYLHGFELYGFYAVVGALGLAGVVINDSIIMLVKLDNEYDNESGQSQVRRQIADISATRLRAVILTTLTTVAGVMPTAYGLAGYDAMLAEMMMALAWGMLFGTVITLVLIPCVYNVYKDTEYLFKGK